LEAVPFKPDRLQAGSTFSFLEGWTVLAFEFHVMLKQVQHDGVL